MSDPDDVTSPGPRSRSGVAKTVRLPADRGFPPEGVERGEAFYDAKTVRVPTDAEAKAAERRAARTTIVRRASTATGSTDASAAASAADEDPIAGWLVITAGPGRGAALPLGYGYNIVGRDPGSRVSIDFGDPAISRERHCAVAYEHRGRTFHFAHLDGRNLSMVNGTPVLDQILLRAGDVISFGSDTRLRFVPLCGPDFDWDGHP